MSVPLVADDSSAVIVLPEIDFTSKRELSCSWFGGLMVGGLFGWLVGSKY